MTKQQKIAIQQKEIDKASEKMREAMREGNMRKYNTWSKRFVLAKCLIRQIKEGE